TRERNTVWPLTNGGDALLTFNPENTQHMPRLSIDVEAIASHLETLADAEPCPYCGTTVTIVTSDAAHLIIEVNRLSAALADVRLKAANLRAAMSAALSAEADGETDPLVFLREEITDAGTDDNGGDWCR